MTPPPFLLITSPDDYLLELERGDVESSWRRERPDGEVRVYAEPPSPSHLIRDLASPSLFAPARLLIVSDARSLIAGKGARAADVNALAASLASIPTDEVWLLLLAVVESEPSGPVVQAVASRGEVRHQALPPPPKPWEEARLTAAQRAVLHGVLRRVAPEALRDPETADALCETYGFRPRELAQAARRLVAAGELSADAVRAQAGPGELALRTLEDVLIRRDPAAAASFFASLETGAALIDWRGDAIEPDRIGRVTVNALARLLRLAVAVRGHAARSGLGRDLDPRRCAGSRWYPTEFKNRIHPRLAAEAEASPGSPVVGMTAWTMHRVFRLAAAYREREMLDALARLARGGAEVAKASQALPTLSSAVLQLVAH
ncbi:MAG: hypothetical protein AB1625_10350 [Acidobacteriota bacterium]